MRTDRKTDGRTGHLKNSTLFANPQASLEHKFLKRTKFTPFLNIRQGSSALNDEVSWTS